MQSVSNSDYNLAYETALRKSKHMEHAEAKAIGVKHVNLVRGLDMVAGLVLMASAAFLNDAICAPADIFVGFLALHIGMIPTFGGIKAPFLAWVTVILGSVAITLPWGLSLGIVGVDPASKLINVICGTVIVVCGLNRALFEPRPEVHDDITPPEGCAADHHHH